MASAKQVLEDAIRAEAERQGMTNPFVDEPMPASMVTNPYFESGGHNPILDLISKPGASTSADDLGQALFTLSGETRAPEGSYREQLAAEQRSRRAGVDDFLAIQEQLIPDTPAEGAAGASNLLEQEAEVSEVMAPHMKARREKGIAQYFAIAEAMGDPSTTEAEAQDAIQQWQRKYPDLAGQVKPTAMSRQQIAELKKQMREDEYNQAVQQIASGGVPDKIVFTDEKGNIDIPAGIRDFWKTVESQKADAAKAAADSRKQLFDTQTSAMAAEAKALDEIYKSSGGEMPFAEYQKGRIDIQRRLNKITNQFLGIAPQQAEVVGPAPTTPQKVSPVQGIDLPTYQARRLKAEAAGAAFPLDQDDYDALASGTVYISPLNGKRYQKP